MPRNNKMQKVITTNSRETRAKRDQTFSAQHGSQSRFGTNKSMVHPDDTRGLVRMYGASRSRKPPKVTLVKMPWEET